MIKKKRVSKYLLYAIGEIVLVVIGILIALQINNWNEQQKMLAKEQTYLSALKEEFLYNKEQVENVVESNTKFGDAADEILKLTGPEEPTISEKDFIKLFLNMVNSEVQYRPSNGVLQEIISSGKLSIFRDTELRKMLSSWDGILYRVRFQEAELNRFRMELIDIVNEQGNVKELFYTTYPKTFHLTPSRFDNENRGMLRSLVFESRTTSFLVTSRFTNKNYYIKVENNINEILDRIERSLI
jgi:hypothetical protein